MKVLFLSDNFTPERNAPASRTHEHAAQWVRDGHEVTVITTAPNFPEGSLFPGYKNRWYSAEVLDGIRVVRVKTYISANNGLFLRTLDYISFMVAGGIVALFSARPDVLVTTSPQFFCAMAGWFVAKVRRLPWVFELRDLWPASIVAVGAMKKNWVIRILEHLELRMYRDADHVISVTHSFSEDLVARGVPRIKIDVILNGVDCESYFPRPKDQSVQNAHALTGRFVVGYLGTIGMAHALDKVIDAAKLLRNRTDIVLLIVGAGARRTDIERLVKEHGLQNVRMLAPQPKTKMPALWSVHDLALIPLRNEELFKTVIPSKMFEAMGMGVPILMSLPEGEATRLLRSTGAGICVPPENPREMADTIIALADDKALMKKLRQCCLDAAPCFNRSEQARLMMCSLQKVANAGKANRRSRQIILKRRY